MEVIKVEYDVILGQSIKVVPYEENKIKVKSLKTAEKIKSKQQLNARRNNMRSK